MLIAAILFGVMAFMVKVLTFTVSPEQIVFARFFVGGLTILFFILIKFARITFNNKYLLIFRGIVGSIAIVFYFRTASLIPISDTIVLQMTYPIFATIFAAIFLGEKLKKRSIVAMLIAFVGIVMVASPVFNQFNIGYIYGLISSILAGAAIVATRRLRTTDSSWAITFSLMICGTIIGLVLGVGKMVLPDTNGFILLIGMALIATLAQLLLNFSYKFCDVATGTTISMVTVPVTVLLAGLFLGEIMSLSFAIGTFLIISSIFYILQTSKGSSSVT